MFMVSLGLESERQQEPSRRRLLQRRRLLPDLRQAKASPVDHIDAQNPHRKTGEGSSDPSAIRTRDPFLRREVLYPAELWNQRCKNIQ